MNFKLFKMKFKLLNLSLINLPSPMNISYLWNFGSLLGLCLIIQILTGIFLALHYISDVNISFYIINYIHRDVYMGWLLKLIHFNGASFFFICIYFHVGRNIYYESFNLVFTWISGIIILLMLMMIAFLGYVLPWGQMSFWGATVITNLLSTFPYIGMTLVNWLWGGFSINNSTLVRFFSFHFLFPFILVVAILMHLFFLHKTGSNNPLGINSDLDKIPFYFYFMLKDLLGYLILILLLGLILLINSYLFGDPDNFIKANSMVTPVHIQPEWYFLFVYAILRCIPNKFGGVIGLFMSILILLILPFCFKKLIKGNQFYLINQLMFWMFLNYLILLTWLGAKSVEDPYILASQIITILYFMYYLLNPFIYMFWDKYLKFI